MVFSFGELAQGPSIGGVGTTGESGRMQELGSGGGNREPGAGSRGRVGMS